MSLARNAVTTDPKIWHPCPPPPPPALEQGIQSYKVYTLPAIIIVLALPPRLSLSSHVSTELRYGMNIFFLESFPLLLAAFSDCSAVLIKKNLLTLTNLCANLSSLMKGTVRKMSGMTFPCHDGQIGAILYEKILYNWLPKAEITVPNVTKDLLMFAPSFSLTPVAPVELARSLSNGISNN